MKVKKTRYVMKKFLRIFIPLVIVGGIIYQFRNDIKVRIEPFLDNAVSQINIQIGRLNPPCVKPITYTVDALDPKFGISREYFLSAMLDAEKIWEKSFGKELFVYVSDIGDLKINLVYDYRQQATDKLTSVGITVQDDRTSYDTLKKKFADLRAQLTVTKKRYESRVANFDERRGTYEEQVVYWNARGGASKEKYDALRTEKSALDVEVRQLRILQEQIDEMVDEINALVVVLNRLVGVLNLSVDQYNEINNARGGSFEEGVYQSNGIDKKIDIYEFSNREKLVRVLAHELGHALDLEHVSDPRAIMYEFNQGNNQILTNADLMELKAHCEVK